MKISIVIPSKNEAEYVDQLLNYIQKNSNQSNIEEIIIVESFNTKQIVKVAEKRHAKLYYNLHGSTELQMDMGAFQAKGEIIYFIKPDCIPPKGFDERIIEHIENEHAMGCFDNDKNNTGSFIKFLITKICRILFKDTFKVTSFFIVSKLYYHSGGLKKHSSYVKLKKEVSLNT